jgi:hypothetical protein
MKRRGRSGRVAESPLALDTFDQPLDGSPTLEEVGAQLSKAFRVGVHEVALYRLEKGFLRFLLPAELKTAGAIPLSSSAVTAHTASSQKTELFNNFIKVKHASVFENVKLGDKEHPAETAPIQKLISAPILDEQGDVLGVVQVCRKGADPSCGPDFSIDDLQRLELAAKVLAQAPFMQPSSD